MLFEEVRLSVKISKTKSGTQFRGILVLAAITAVSTTTVLSGCGQRARLRAAAPATESPVSKKADGAAGKKDDKTAAPDVGGLSKETPPGAEAPTGVAASTGAAQAPTDEVRLYGEAGATHLASLEAGRIGALKALTEAQLAVQEGRIRLNDASASLVGMAQTHSFINMDEAALKSYCYLFRGDSRVSHTSGENEICDKEKHPGLTVEMAKDFDTTELESRPCVDIRVVARFYETALKSSEAALNDQLATNDDFKKLDVAMTNFDTIDNMELAGDDKKAAFDFYNAVNEGHKQNTEAAKAITSIAEAAKCSLK